MRISKTLDVLFPKTRRAILSATLVQADRSWYLSDLAKHLDVTPSSLQRELAALVEAGILRRRRDGNRVYFQADSDCPILPELRSIVLKTAGLADVLREQLEPFSDRIRHAFIYGSIARSEERSSSDVDLMVVGRVGLADIAPALRAAEGQLGRPVNATVYEPLEFAKKLRAGHHFLNAVLGAEKVFIYGSPDGLAATTRKWPRSPARHQQTGT